MSSVPKTKCDEPPLLGSTFRMNRESEAASDDPSIGLQTRRSPSSLSRMRGTPFVVFGVCTGAFERTMAEPLNKRAQMPTNKLTGRMTASCADVAGGASHPQRSIVLQSYHDSSLRTRLPVHEL